MRLLKIAPVLVGAAFLSSACTELYEPKPHLVQFGKETVISNTASLSHIIQYDFTNDSRSCTQPYPDAAFNQGESSDFSFSLVSLGGGNDEGKQDDNSQEVEMAGRSPAVLITRELFYRLCEFSKNQKLDKAEAKDLYVQTLGTVKDVWTVEAGKTSVKIGETVTQNNVTNVTSSGAETGASSTSSSTSTATISTATTESQYTAAGGTWDSTEQICS